MASFGKTFLSPLTIMIIYVLFFSHLGVREGLLLCSLQFPIIFFNKFLIVFYGLLTTFSNQIDKQAEEVVNVTTQSVKYMYIYIVHGKYWHCIYSDS